MAAGKKAMEVVRGLDLEKYMGRWYEIASFPSWFQPKDGVDTRATYALKPDGTVNVLNETWAGGKRVSIEGTAYKADPGSDEAKLKILCRQTHMDEEVYKQLVEKAKEEGYDVNRLHKTPQSDPPPEAEPGCRWWIKPFFGN